MTDIPIAHLGKSSTLTVCGKMISSLPENDVIADRGMEDYFSNEPFTKNCDGYYKCEDCWDVDIVLEEIREMNDQYYIAICEF